MTVDDPDFMENYKKAIIQYARNYIQANPDKFAVGVDGKVYRISK
jgi:septum formation topological specificity factor MinE